MSWTLCRWSWPGSNGGCTDCGSDRAGLLRGSDTGRSPEHWPQGNDRLTSVFCLGRFCRARHPAPFWWRPALFKNVKWHPALLTKKNTTNYYYYFFKCQSHMAFSSVLSFLLSAHSIDCAVSLLLSVYRVNSALFLPFTALIAPFFFSSPCKLCSFDGPFTALNVYPF